LGHVQPPALPSCELKVDALLQQSRSPAKVWSGSCPFQMSARSPIRRILMPLTYCSSSSSSTIQSEPMQAVSQQVACKAQHVLNSHSDTSAATCTKHKSQTGTVTLQLKKANQLP
jgi:hypothetical protein